MEKEIVAVKRKNQLEEYQLEPVLSTHLLLISKCPKWILRLILLPELFKKKKKKKPKRLKILSLYSHTRNRI